MADKKYGIISQVTINSPVFRSEKFKPTLINYFYGKNGVGKSTIAKLIGRSDCTEWSIGEDSSTYRLLVYNEEFIQEQIQSYGNIPGVFTITQQNAVIKKTVDEKTSELRTLSGQKDKITDSINSVTQRISDLNSVFVQTIWSKSETIRKNAYPLAKLKNANNKQRFSEELLLHSAMQVDEAALQVLYTVAYGEDSKRYVELKPVSLSSIPSSTLLSKQIISSNNTVFADFLKAINATAWVSQGHRDYQHSAGSKCPYCQQELPITFETDLASCFDEQYKREIEELNRFIQLYRNALNEIYAILNANSKNDYPCDFISNYKTEFELFMEKAKSNMALLERKKNDPAITIELEELSEYLKRLNDIADEINQQIRQNNAILNDKPAKQKDCIDRIWSLIAEKCHSDITIYQADKSKIEEELAKLGKEKEETEKEIHALEIEIAKLNKQHVNTTAAKDSINALIRSSGFQGFQLREKPGAQYVYQLVRADGSIARGLSEGERHFIAFLYFYHMVMGSQSDKGKIESKIVVIDDPVSSMDSGALFTVASLVRDMIGVCYNNYRLTDNNEQKVDDHIKQIFCLTHNPFFFKEIIYNRISDYECVSVYEIKKQENNRSIIEICEQAGSRTGDKPINRNPVMNTYEALWKEYRTSNEPIALLNVTRRILEYYFLQMCGYSNGDIRSDLLERHRAAFEIVHGDGYVDRTKYNMVDAMISAMGAGALSFNEGFYFDPYSIDTTLLKETFRQIFDVLHQMQHYNMMMQE